MQFFSYLKYKFWHMSKKIFFLKLIINVGVKLSKISMLKKELLKKYFLEINLVEINQKTCKFFLI